MSLLSLSPEDTLRFYRNFQDAQSQQLQLTNHNLFSVAFKVKTTSPMDFTVNPSQGFLVAGASIPIVVSFLPSATAFTKTHKFLVQATASNATDMAFVDWSSTESYRLVTQMLDPVTDAPSYTEYLEQKLKVERVTTEKKSKDLEALKTEVETLVQKKAQLIQEQQALRSSIETSNLKLKCKQLNSTDFQSEGYAYSTLGACFAVGLVLGYFLLG